MRWLILSAAALVWVAVACDSGDDVEFPDSGPSATAAGCLMPPLDVLQPGAIPPNPADLPPAPECATGSYDAIIVLGCPSNAGGSPSQCQRARVELALAFAAAGYADAFIVTGGAVANEHVEADALAGLLIDAGVAGEQVVREPRAEHTDENFYYSTLLMEARGWESALVVSDVGHLLYTALCDADCCVRLGRMSVLSFDLAGAATPAGHYVLTPPAEPVSDDECAHLGARTRFQCTQLDARRACAFDFQLEPPE